MNKVLKILSILVIGFVMFSCSTPTNDPTHYVPEESGPETPAPNPAEPSGPETPAPNPAEPSGPETPVETPSDNPVEETPAVPTYSIIFTTEDDRFVTQIITDYLNTLPEFKNLKEGTEVMLYKYVYINSDGSEVTTEMVKTSVYRFGVFYNAKPGIDSVVIGNEDVEVKVYDILQHALM